MHVAAAFPKLHSEPGGEVDVCAQIAVGDEEDTSALSPSRHCLSHFHGIGRCTADVRRSLGPGVGIDIGDDRTVRMTFP